MSYAFDEYGRRIIIEDTARPGRYRHRHSSGWDQQPQARPAQIIINNENNVIEDDYYEPPPPRRHRQAAPVYVTEQQVVQVNRNRSPSELSYSTRRALDELERRQRDEKQEELMKQFEKDFALKEAKKREDEEKRKEAEKELKKKAVEEWQAEQEKKEREKKEKEAEKEKIGQEYLRQQLRREGWTEDEIDEVIKKKEKKEQKLITSSTTVVLAERPRYIKVHKKHIDPATLNAYGLEWDWAEEDGYIYIHKRLSEDDQDILFEHTKKLHQRKLLKFAEVEVEEKIIVKNVGKDRAGRLVMTRKKEHKPAAKKKTFFI